MANEIVKQQTNLGVFQTIVEMAPYMHRSRLFGVSSPEQAVAIMVKGHELGLGFAQAFEFVHVIQGKPTLSPRGALALALNSGLITEMEIIEERDKQGKPFLCTVKGARGSLKYSASFTMDDAKAAGLIKSGGAWETYPANMLKWRAIGFWLDVLFPDTQGGMKRADEFGAWVDDKGDVIDAETAENETLSLSIDTLIADFGVNEVMQVITEQFSGNMPQSQDDLLKLEIELAKIASDETNEAVAKILNEQPPTYDVLYDESEE